MYSFWQKIVIVTVVYILAALIGEMLTTPFGYASFFWAAGGTSLFFILYWGYGVWPGIFFGSVLASIIESYIDGGVNPDLVFFTLSLFFMAFTVVIKAVFPAIIYRSIVSWPTPLKEYSDIIWLIVIGGGLGALISSVMIGGFFYSVNITEEGSGFYRWFLWWAGDALGIVAVTPLMIMMSLPKEQTPCSRKMHVVIPVALAMSLIIGFFMFLKNTHETNQEQRFAQDAENINSIIDLRLQKYQQASKSVQAFYNASNYVSREEFNIFTKHLVAKNEGIKALFWMPRVPYNNRPVFVQDAKLDGVDFKMVERNAKGIMAPSRKREIYFPIYYIYPFLENKDLFGLNMSADEEYQEALLTSEEEAIDVATKTIQHQKRYIARNTLSFFIFAPVFEQGGVNDSDLRGYVGGLYDLNKVFDKLRFYLEGRDKTILVYEQDAKGNYQKFFEIRSNKTAGRGGYFMYTNEADNEYKSSTEVVVSSRKWRVEISQPKLRPSETLPMIYFVTMIFGILFISALVVLMCITRTEEKVA